MKNGKVFVSNHGNFLLFCSFLYHKSKRFLWKLIPRFASFWLRIFAAEVFEAFFQPRLPSLNGPFKQEN